MKKTILLIAILTFVISATAQNIPSYVPTDSLIGYWGFDGDANDYSGNSNNGTVFGASLTNDRNGNANAAYFFDVSNWSFGSGGDYIYIPYNPSFNFQEFTISSWVNRASAGSTISPQSLSIIRRFEYGYNNPNGESWILDIAHGTNENGAVLSGTVIEQSPSPANNFYCKTTQTVPQSEWTQITMTYSQNTIKLYINGDLVCNTLNPSININTVGNSGISIGVSNQANGHWSPFDGAIDDIGIWSRALSDSEIKGIYNENICTDTIQIMVYDTTFVTINDTITYNDTNYVSINDTITYYETVSVAVTDTLIIDTEILRLNSPNKINTLKVYPNPANDIVIIDNGDFSSMSDYKLKIVNSLGAEVFNSFVSIPQFQIPVSSLGNSGLYYIQIFDDSYTLLSTKKLVIK